MIRNFKIKLIIIFAVVCIGAGTYLSYSYFVPKDKKETLYKVPVAVHQLYDIRNVFKKLITKEAVVEKIKKAQEIITTEVELREDVTWNDSWGKLEVFKKNQNIYFFGTGLYILNLSNLNPESVEVDKERISIKVPYPKVKGVIIDEQKTSYQPIEKGLLRFGDIKLLPQEYQIMMQEVKQKMTLKMEEGKLYEQAVKNSEETLKNMLQLIMKNEMGRNYDVRIYFEKENI